MKFVKILTFLLLFGCNSQSGNIVCLNLANTGLKQIPDTVFTFTKLKALNLSNNFTLYPPLSVLSSTSVDSTLNQIENIPKEIARLEDLQRIELSYINLKSLPKEIVHLKQLDTLDISFNENFSIDSHFTIFQEMKWLKYLNIVGTHFTTNDIEKLQRLLTSTKIISNLNIESGR